MRMKPLSELHLGAALAAAAMLACVSASAAETKPPPTWNADALKAEFDRALDAADAELDAILVAHSGGLAKDGCHRDRKAGERHHHKDGSVERAGPCLKIDGRTWRFAGNAVCAAERAAMARDEGDGWGIDWQRHAKALKRCILRIRPNPRR